MVSFSVELGVIVEAIKRARLVTNDPAEAKNIAESNAEVVARLHAELRKFGTWSKDGVGAYDEGRPGFKAPKDWIVYE